MPSVTIQHFMFTGSDHDVKYIKDTNVTKKPILIV